MAAPKLLPVITTPLPGAFIEIPGLLIVRLMSRCNNRCIFCMVDGEIHASSDVPFDDAARAIQRQPVSAKIEFFGGEPTIYPRFLELVELARLRGHTCSLASHGRTFANERFAARLAALGTESIYVRTSLYGHTAELHDSYTAVSRSFDQTIRGIENLVAAGFRTQVNLVIMARNVNRLMEMTRLVHELRVPRIKFSNLVNVSFCPHEAVSLDVVRPRLSEAVDYAESLGLRVTIEKTPVCVASGRLDLMSTERLIGAWDRTHDDGGGCGHCLVRRWCDGVDPEYPQRFGFAGLAPLHVLPTRAVRFAVEDDVAPEFLKVHCVRLRHDSTEDVVPVIAALADRVEARLGLLAVIPERFIDM